MGVDGTGIFSDDTACDVRSRYRELLEDDVADDEAWRTVVAEFGEDADDAPVMWLALAAEQARLGRLVPEVRDAALAVIEDGSDLARWREASPRTRAARRAALGRLARTLTGPPAARRALRRPVPRHTSLCIGDLLSRTGVRGTSLWLVVAVSSARSGSEPVLRRLWWPEACSASEHRVAALAARPAFPQWAARSSVVWIARHGRETLEASGFSVTGRASPVPEHARPDWTWGGTIESWRMLAERLDHDQETADPTAYRVERAAAALTVLVADLEQLDPSSRGRLDEVLVLAEAGEPEIALTDLTDAVRERALPLTVGQLDLVTALADDLGVPHDSWGRADLLTAALRSAAAEPG